MFLENSFAINNDLIIVILIKGITESENGQNPNSLLIVFYFCRLLPVYLHFQNLPKLSFQYSMNMVPKKAKQ